MKHPLIAAAALALLAHSAVADCTQDSYNNYYCDEVDAITYTNVGGKGTYNRITSMDGSTGNCASSAQGYSGSLSPLDEEVTMHFRGPLILNQFAVYQPKLAPNPRRNEHIKKHAHHGHHHARHAEPKPAVGDMVTATINGQVVSWVNEYSGLATPAAAPASEPASQPGTATTQSTITTTATLGYEPTSQSSSQSQASAAQDPATNQRLRLPGLGKPKGQPSPSYSGSGWSRSAYWNASSGSAQGLTFLNHMGGQGSGTFDMKFGNSLSYASKDCKSGSSSPQIPNPGLWDDNTEILLASDKECDPSVSGDGGCGYYRPGNVAYHGWDGPKKAFLMEFSMPNSGKQAASKYQAADMPAIWMLNAQIPRTLQYGNGECSCWLTGCGEFDIIEVLSPGFNKAKSTLHTNKPGGDSNYFARPVSGSMKLAVVMTEDAIHIKKLDASFSFDNGLTQDELNDITESSSRPGLGVSLFRVVDTALGG